MNPIQDQSLGRILESAVVVSWADLVSNIQNTLIQLEYDFAPSGTFDSMKVWSSIARGHWLLACSYWMSPSEFHDSGIHFDNGYHSEGLAHILDFVMQHQSAFTLPRNLGRQGLLQISAPTQEETTAATELIRQAAARLESRLTQPVLA